MGYELPGFRVRLHVFEAFFERPRCEIHVAVDDEVVWRASVESAAQSHVVRVAVASVGVRRVCDARRVLGGYSLRCAVGGVVDDMHDAYAGRVKQRVEAGAQLVVCCVICDY